MSGDELLVERRGAVATLVFNRPQQRNALTTEMLASLREAFEKLPDNGETRVILLRGAGERAFSSGYDFGALQELQREGVALSTPEDPFEEALETLRACPLPTIALLHGFAVGGGCALAAGCDLRVAAESARLGMPPAKLGLAYSEAGLRPFLELIGPARTRYLFYTGRLIGAAEAYAMGLVDMVRPDDEADAAAMALAEEIAANAPLSIRATKTVLARLAETPSPGAAARAVIAEAVRRANASHDLQEGQRAFLEKRPPRFEGR